MLEIYLDLLQQENKLLEYEETYPDLIAHCLHYDCKKKKIMCLNILRKMNGDNTQYLRIIDRFIDDITGNYNPSGEVVS